MKKKTLLVFLVSFSFFLSLPSFAIDRETLWAKLNFLSSLAEIRETNLAARQNLGLVEEILFFSDMQRHNGPARDNALEILKECSENGQITKEHFFSVVLRLLNQITTIAHPTVLEDSKDHIKGVLTSFGISKFSLTNQFSAFPSLANSLSSGGFIKNQGILNSLNQKISNAQKSVEQKGVDAKSSAVNQIEAAINELNAQRGQGVTEDCYQILSGYCKNLITKIQKSN